MKKEIYHSGVKGQRKGRRRYQNLDGSLTPLGRIHYGYGLARSPSGPSNGYESLYGTVLEPNSIVRGGGQSYYNRHAGPRIYEVDYRDVENNPSNNRDQNPGTNNPSNNRDQNPGTNNPSNNRDQNSEKKTYNNYEKFINIADRGRILANSVENLSINEHSKHDKQKIKRYTNKLLKELEFITDQDLSYRVRRLTAEKSYMNLMTERNVDIGKNATKDAMRKIGGLLAVGSSAAGLALTIKQLRGN